jgi:DNA-binding HxlR family transcriptional regulator
MLDRQLIEEKLVSNPESKIAQILVEAGKKGIRYEDLVKSTTLSRRTVSLRLKRMMEKGLINRNVDVESGKYPIPVYYRWTNPEPIPSFKPIEEEVANVKREIDSLATEVIEDMAKLQQEIQAMMVGDRLSVVKKVLPLKPEKVEEAKKLAISLINSATYFQVKCLGLTVLLNLVSFYILSRKAQTIGSKEERELFLNSKSEKMSKEHEALFNKIVETYREANPPEDILFERIRDVSSMLITDYRHTIKECRNTVRKIKKIQGLQNS